MEKKGQFALYGMGEYLGVIEKVHEELGLTHDNIEVKLILTEALHNAHKHGNGGAAEKPIFLRYHRFEKHAIFEIEDGGKGFARDAACMENVPDILSECGRGLFIIENLSDEVEYHGNKIRIQVNI